MKEVDFPVETKFKISKYRKISDHVYDIEEKNVKTNTKLFMFAVYKVNLRFLPEFNQIVDKFKPTICFIKLSDDFPPLMLLKFPQVERYFRFKQSEYDTLPDIINVSRSIKSKLLNKDEEEEDEEEEE